MTKGGSVMTHKRTPIQHATPVWQFQKFGLTVFLGALVLPLAIGLTGIKPAQAADSYLDAINAEGDRLEVLGQAKKEQELLMRSAPASSKENTKPKPVQKKQVKATPAPVPSTAPSAAAARVPGSATNQEFEQALRKNFPGSFALYSLLEPKQQEAVFNEYDQSTAEGPARFLPVVTKIISFTTAKNRTR